MFYLYIGLSQLRYCRLLNQYFHMGFPLRLPRQLLNIAIFHKFLYESDYIFTHFWGMALRLTEFHRNPTPIWIVVTPSIKFGTGLPYPQTQGSPLAELCRIISYSYNKMLIRHPAFTGSPCLFRILLYGLAILLTITRNTKCNCYLCHLAQHIVICLEGGNIKIYRVTIYSL